MILREAFLREKEKREGEFPFTLPVIAKLGRLVFQTPVTFFVGENGSGKSTLLEGLAAAAGLSAVAREDMDRDPFMGPARVLGRALGLRWEAHERRGFFLRSEDFIGYIRRLKRMRSEARERLEEIEEEYADRSEYARQQARMPPLGTLRELEKRYGKGLEYRSHGEGFLDFFQSRFVPGGIYLLDEPETPLSPMRQLGLLSMLGEMVERGSQCIIATHAPLLMAFPGATIYSFDSAPPQAVDFEELEHVNLTRDFLNDPGRFLRHL